MASATGCSSKLALEPIQLRFPAALPMSVHHGQRLGQHPQPFCLVALSVPYASASRARSMGGPALLPQWPGGGQALAHLRHPLLSLALLASAQPRRIVPSANQCVNPCSVESASAASACSWVSCARPGGTDGARRPQSQGIRQAIGSATAPGPGSAPHGSAAGPDPDSPATTGSERHRIGSPPQGHAHGGTPASGAAGVVEGHALLQVCAGRGQLSKIESRYPPAHSGPPSRSAGSLATLRQAQELFPQLPCRLQLRPSR